MDDELKTRSFGLHCSSAAGDY